jgi:hypothetical protein
MTIVSPRSTASSRLGRCALASDAWTSRQRSFIGHFGKATQPYEAAFRNLERTPPTHSAKGHPGLWPRSHSRRGRLGYERGGVGTSVRVASGQLQNL